MDTPLNLIVVGPPASGKGTLSKKLSEHYGLTHIEAGTILRERAAIGDALGQEIDRLISAGNFAPESLIIKPIFVKLTSEACAKGFILDGFPRTTSQAQKLDLFLKSQNMALSHVFNLVADEDQLIARMQKRASESSAKRADDSLTIFYNRMSKYRELTALVGPYYQSQNLTREIDANGSIEMTWENAQAAIISKRPKKL